MEVYNGAPAESRSDVENRVYAALAQLEIPFTRVDHEPAFTMEDCAAISEALDVHICKNLLLTPRNRSAFYLLCLPAENSFSRITRSRPRKPTTEWTSAPSSCRRLAVG